MMDTRDKASRWTLLLRWAVCLVVIGLMGSGCEMLGLGGGDSKSGGGKNKQKQKQSDKGDKAEQKAAEGKSAEKEEQAYERPEYPGGTRRNPFLPSPEVIEPEEPVDTGKVRPLEPLEKYTINSLQLAAIISETAVPKAMFIDPEGFGHVVKEGDRIGRNGGEITDIRDNEVEIREVTEGEDEETQTKLKTVQLRSEKLEAGADDEGGLSEEDREVLRELLESEQGREAIQEAYRDQSSGSGTSQQQQGGGDQDDRFRGLAPPDEQ